MVAHKAKKKKESMSSIVPVLTSQKITQNNTDISPEDQTQHAQEDKQFIEHQKFLKFTQDKGISGNLTNEEYLQYKEAQGEEKEEIS